MRTPVRYEVGHSSIHRHVCVLLKGGKRGETSGWEKEQSLQHRRKQVTRHPKGWQTYTWPRMSIELGAIWPAWSQKLRMRGIMAAVFAWLQKLTQAFQQIIVYQFISLSCSCNNSYCVFGPRLAAKVQVSAQVLKKRQSSSSLSLGTWLWHLPQPHLLPRLGLWGCLHALGYIE